jgi:hypothetical protein
VEKGGLFALCANRFLSQPKISLPFKDSVHPYGKKQFCRRMKQSPKGEEIDSIAPTSALFFWCHFLPKNHKSSPKSTKPLHKDNIHVAF